MVPIEKQTHQEDALLQDTHKMGWTRQRTTQELKSFVNTKLAMLGLGDA